MSLRNISNFFNIIKKGRLKSQLADTDMIPVGTRDITNRSVYQDTAISFKDLKTQVASASGVTAVTGTAPIVSSGGTTPAISIPKATGSTDGFLDSVSFTAFSAKQDALTFNAPSSNNANPSTSAQIKTALDAKQDSLTLTTTGSGAATLVGSTLNVPTPAASPLLTTTVTYTGAEIIAGGKVILAAPGAGKYYMIHSCTIKFKDATVPFNTTDPYSINLAGGSGLQVINLPSGTTESIWGYASGPCFENGALSIGPHVGSQPTAGDGNLVFDITYELKDF